MPERIIEWKPIAGKTGYMILDQSLVVTYDINDRETVIIDSGYRERPELIKWARGNGKEIKAVLCTHFHVDHMGNNGLLQREMGTEIFASAREYEVQQTRFNSDDPISFKWMDREKYFFGASGRFDTVVLPPDQREIIISGCRFKVEPLLGHSPGHIGFATPDGILHIGDAFMSDMVLRHSKVPYELNITETLKTLERVKYMGYKYYAASHRAVIPEKDIAKTLDDNIDYHNNMLDQIERRLNGWQRMDRFIMEVIENRGVQIKNTRSIGWLPVAVRSYIEHLIREGRVVYKTGPLNDKGWGEAAAGNVTGNVTGNAASNVMNDADMLGKYSLDGKVYIKRTGK